MTASSHRLKPPQDPTTPATASSIINSDQPTAAGASIAPVVHRAPNGSSSSPEIGHPPSSQISVDAIAESPIDKNFANSNASSTSSPQLVVPKHPHGNSHLALPPSPSRQRRHSFTYEPEHENSSEGDNIGHSHSDETYNEMPLSMRFMHKPSRSKELLEKASDPTRHNSLLNSHLSDIQTNISTTTDTGTTSSSPSTENSPSLINDSPEMPMGGYKLVRKKSGELVKPSLKDSSAAYFGKKRSQSLPTTPTYKQVHFGGDTDVRYFKKKDTPSALSAANSPTLEGSEILVRRIHFDSEEDSEDDETDDYDEGDEGDDEHYDTSNNHHKYSPVHNEEEDEDYNNFNLNSAGSTKYPRKKPAKNIDWQLKLLNFPVLSYDSKIKKEVPVFLERLFISMDKKYLLGHIAVRNIAFEKYLTVRYSLDNWMTIIEIPTLYAPDRPDVLKRNNYDRFIFQVPLENLFNSFRLTSSSSEDSLNQSTDSLLDNPSQKSQEKVYQICIKYCANNTDYWDNNAFKNYEIKLVKTVKTSLNNFNPKIQDHAAKPKYSSSYLKRIVSDSQIELKKKQNKAEQKESVDNTEKKEDPFYLNDNSSSDRNDFVKNNYYLSSPLLSSYNSSGNNAAKNSGNSNLSSSFNAADLTDSLPNKNKIVISPTPIPSSPSGYKIKFNEKHGGSLDNFNMSTGTFGTNGAERYTTGSPVNSNKSSEKQKEPAAVGPNFLNSKSYKELLDNYCFFSSSSNNGDDTTIPTSSDNYQHLSSPLNSHKPPFSSSSTSSTESNGAPKKNGSFTVSSFLDV
ncbi:putative phosphatase regulatory subunit-domain-containing protein [Scheffersomyces xylosifermentans]|uniref:putative phosphatase regulatory subunit-domain-containing protein n=1 Tax=Scheffersomyces xylosifermentans TaxID=1304137 RepID=UPI00315D4B6F